MCVSPYYVTFPSVCECNLFICIIPLKIEVETQSPREVIMRNFGLAIQRIIFIRRTVTWGQLWIEMAELIWVGILPTTFF